MILGARRGPRRGIVLKRDDSSLQRIPAYCGRASISHWSRGPQQGAVHRGQPVARPNARRISAGTSPCERGSTRAMDQFPACATIASPTASMSGAPITWTERAASWRAHKILCVSDHPPPDPEIPASLDPAKLEIVPTPSTRISRSRISRGRRRPPVATDPHRGGLTATTLQGRGHLIEAMPLVRRQLPMPPVVVGGGNDEARLRGLAQENGGPDAVEILA